MRAVEPSTNPVSIRRPRSPRQPAPILQVPMRACPTPQTIACQDRRPVWGSYIFQSSQVEAAVLLLRRISSRANTPSTWHDDANRCSSLLDQAFILEGVRWCVRRRTVDGRTRIQELPRSKRRAKLGPSARRSFPPALSPSPGHSRSSSTLSSLLPIKPSGHPKLLPKLGVALVPKMLCPDARFRLNLLPSLEDSNGLDARGASSAAYYIFACGRILSSRCPQKGDIPPTIQWRDIGARLALVGIE